MAAAMVQKLVGELHHVFHRGATVDGGHVWSLGARDLMQHGPGDAKESIFHCPAIAEKAEVGGVDFGLISSRFAFRIRVQTRSAAANSSIRDVELSLIYPLHIGPAAGDKIEHGPGIADKALDFGIVQGANGVASLRACFAFFSLMSITRCSSRAASSSRQRDLSLLNIEFWGCGYRFRAGLVKMDSRRARLMAARMGQVVSLPERTLVTRLAPTRAICANFPTDKSRFSIARRSILTSIGLPFRLAFCAFIVAMLQHLGMLASTKLSFFWGDSQASFLT